jgi:hypothetical protein
VGDIEQLGDADLRQILQRKAPPLLFLTGRKRRSLEPLERREAVFQ